MEDIKEKINQAYESQKKIVIEQGYSHDYFNAIELAKEMIDDGFDIESLKEEYLSECKYSDISDKNAEIVFNWIKK